MKTIKIIAVLMLSVSLTNCGNKKSEESSSAESTEVQKATIEHLLEEFNFCNKQDETNLGCKNFASKAICDYNGIEDFKVGNDYLPYDKIYDFVNSSDAWENIGAAPNQEVFEKAQQAANEGKAVIAINTNGNHKLAVLIVKGQLSKSNKWGVKVPQCATFFPANSRQKSFINKTINYTWSNPEGIVFFVKE